MSKQFWGTFAGQLAASIVPLVAIGIVGLLIWRKIFGDQTATGVVENVIDSAASIPGGVKSLIGSTFRGESAATYITWADQQLLAAAELARSRGQGAAQ